MKLLQMDNRCLNVAEKKKKLYQQIFNARLKMKFIEQTNNELFQVSFKFLF